MALTASPRPGTDKPPSDLKIISRDDDAGTFTATVFGEQFLFASGVNGWLMFMASTGKAEHFERLIHSLLLVPGEFTNDGELKRAQLAEADRFSDLLGAQPPREFGIERLFRLVNDLIEAAGNDLTAS